MERYNTDVLRNIDESRLHDGTGAMYYAINSINGREGILKNSSSMLSTNCSDENEHLASVILNKLDVSCASVDLFTDGDNDYCFSYNVLNADEEHVEIPNLFPTNSNFSLDEYFLNYYNNISCLDGIKKDDVDNIFGSYIETTFVNAMLNNFDDKKDNFKVIKNGNGYKKPILYDNGLAFTKNSFGNGVFSASTIEDTINKRNQVISYLLSNYPNITMPIMDKLDSMFSSSEFFFLLNNDMYKKMNKMSVYSDVYENVLYAKNIILEMENSKVK